MFGKYDDLLNTSRISEQYYGIKKKKCYFFKDRLCIFVNTYIELYTV